MSIRLKKGTKEKLKKLGIDPSSEIRKYLENIVWQKDAEKTMDKLEAIIRKRSLPSKSGFAVKSVREDRDEYH